LRRQTRGIDFGIELGSNSLGTHTERLPDEQQLIHPSQLKLAAYIVVGFANLPFSLWPLKIAVFNVPF
jgi:hypothetical protein